ncbi:MarR family winged helix-turn-helix transcriptional regulator [Amycolatopsis sp.]|jgi:DNA-binding MarR family transcriptional regulator|uniref:MarR family winged helix-turn-helix transcriptional regulator n=1 Tax=Amycolatopsis sp. TaxID=37632 RepID=UPI002DF92753|nr:MarR family winged helix-turn-helix transcriptional regulator [Amycolatopsis sp.]
MSAEDDSRIELMRQLKAASQLQQAGLTQIWQAERGMHPAAVHLLSDLAKHGEARPSELAKRRMVDISVVSRQISQLSESGLINRRPAPEDGRASLVQVSEKGREELARWRARYLEFMGHALDDWDEARLSQLIELLSAMNDDLRDTLGPQANCQSPADDLAHARK